MIEWRKVHQKLTTSPSFAKLPDDFTRLLWVLLPLALDKEGRGINRPAWIIGQLFPLRDDVTFVMVERALDALEKAGMIIQYAIDGIPYLCAPNFDKYQRTDRQAESTIPAPTPDLLRTYSGVTPDLLPPRIDKNRIDKNNTADPVDELTTPTTGEQRGPRYEIQSPATTQQIFTQVTGMVSMPTRGRNEALEVLIDLQHKHKKKIVQYLQPFWDEWVKRNYRKTNYSWLDWAIAGEIPPAKEEPTAQGFSHG